MDIRISEMVVDIGLLEANPWNPNTQTDFMKEKLNGSLGRHGQVAEVLVRQLPGGRYQIIDGEHRWLELLAKGRKKVLINNLGEMSDDKAKLLTMAMNEIHGERDPRKMGQILKELKLESDWADIKAVLPFTELELENFVFIADETAKIPEPKEPTGAGGTHWVDVKIQVHQDEKLEIDRMMMELKGKMRINPRPDAALENGELFRVLVFG